MKKFILAALATTTIAAALPTVFGLIACLLVRILSMLF